MSERITSPSARSLLPLTQPVAQKSATPMRATGPDALPKFKRMQENLATRRVGVRYLSADLRGGRRRSHRSGGESAFALGRHRLLLGVLREVDGLLGEV